MLLLWMYHDREGVELSAALGAGSKNEYLCSYSRQELSRRDHSAHGCQRPTSWVICASTHICYSAYYAPQHWDDGSSTKLPTSHFGRVICRFCRLSSGAPPLSARAIGFGDPPRIGARSLGVSQIDHNAREFLYGPV